MYIRTKHKRDRITKKEYEVYQLVESVRTEKGPRQHILLHLGSNLDLDEGEQKWLAQRIEEILSGIQSMFRGTERLEELAELYASQLIKRSEGVQPDGGDVGIASSLEHSQCRTVGVEHIAYEEIRRLEIDKTLIEAGLSKRQREVAIGLIVAKLTSPASERATHEWLQHNSAIDELLGTDFSKLSPKMVYGAGDLLFKHKELLEQRLREKEASLFQLSETIVLYDLTNTYFEGEAQGVSGAARGRSKEKRSDAPLVTLGLLLDHEGFPIRSEMLPGNVSEPSTLKDALSRLSANRPIVVLDAGVATEANLSYLKENGYRYIVASRSRSVELPADFPHETIEVQGGEVHLAQVGQAGDEVTLYCHSSARENKERAMRDLFEKRLEEDLERASASLTKKGGVKRYSKVMERIGRIKERHRRIAHHYAIEVRVDRSGEQAEAVTWSKKEDSLEKRFQGGYLLKAYGVDMSSKELWKTYIMLTRVEAAFRSLKSDLGLRPIWHRLNRRVEAHLFLSILAYHVLQSALYRLRLSGLSISWDTLRQRMSSQARVTSSMRLPEGGQIHIRTTTTPEARHREIYCALGISSSPATRKILRS